MFQRSIRVWMPMLTPARRQRFQKVSVGGKISSINRLFDALGEQSVDLVEKQPTVAAGGYDCGNCLWHKRYSIGASRARSPPLLQAPRAGYRSGDCDGDGVDHFAWPLQCRMAAILEACGAPCRRSAPNADSPTSQSHATHRGFSQEMRQDLSGSPITTTCTPSFRRVVVGWLRRVGQMRPGFPPCRRAGTQASEESAAPVVRSARTGTRAAVVTTVKSG